VAHKPLMTIPITKIDIEQRKVYATMCEERVDKGKEIWDYERGLPLVEKWRDDFLQRTAAAGQEPSMGNVRAMHSPVFAGKVSAMLPLAATKSVDVCIDVLDPDQWRIVKAGGYTGVSIGGDYAARWPDPQDKTVTRYSANIAELSLVDNPAMYGATFQAVKSDGVSELRKFVGVKAATPAPRRMLDALKGWMNPASYAQLEGVIQKDAAATAAAADNVLDGLKQLLVQAALIDGDPSSWTIHQIAEAMGNVLSVKSDARYQVVIQMEGKMVQAPEVTKDDSAAAPAAAAGAAVIDPTAPPAAAAPPEAAKPVESNQDDPNKMALAALTKDLAVLLARISSLASAPAPVAKADASPAPASKPDLSKTDGDALVKGIETSVQKAVTEAVSGVSALVKELQPTLEQLGKAVKHLASMPAPAGSPIAGATKRIGPAGDAVLNSDSAQKVLKVAREQGLNQQAIQELTLALAAELMPH